MINFKRENCTSTYKIGEDWEYKKGVPFEIALTALKEGKRVSHKNWTEKFLLLLNSDTIRIFSPTNGLLGDYWIVNQVDILSEDWYILED